MDNTLYFTFDLPVPYKGLKLYPISMKDYMLFTSYSRCLTIDKNSIPDLKIISMTNLEYIFYATKENVEETPYLLLFDRLLSLCLKDEESFKNMEESINRYKYDDKKGKYFFTIGETDYDSDDFDEIRNIIAEQNLVELIDENISKEVRDSLEKAREFKRKQSGTKSISLEDYMIALSVSAGWKLDYIYTMTARKFLKSIRRMDNLIHYKIYLAASMSGMVEFKDKSFIKHWLSELDDENKYSDVSVDLDEIQDKVSLESAKK